MAGALVKLAKWLDGSSRLATVAVHGGAPVDVRCSWLGHCGRLQSLGLRGCPPGITAIPYGCVLVKRGD